MVTVTEVAAAMVTLTEVDMMTRRDSANITRTATVIVTAMVTNMAMDMTLKSHARTSMCARPSSMSSVTSSRASESSWRRW